MIHEAEVYTSFDTFGAGTPASELRVPNLIVGITGRANAGKDTFFKEAKEELSPWGLGSFSSYKDSFAHPLKLGYASIFGIPVEQLDDAAFKEQINPYTGTTHRKELQLLGTEHYRQRTDNPDVWVQLLAKRVMQDNKIMGAGNIARYPIVFVPDCRFDNEAVFCRNNGIIVKIDRGGNNPIVDNAGHASEQGISYKADFVINNTGSLEEYVKEIRDFVNKSLIQVIELHAAGRLKASLDR